MATNPVTHLQAAEQATVTDRLGAAALFLLPVATVCLPGFRNSSALPLLLVAVAGLWLMRKQPAPALSRETKAILLSVSAFACVYLGDVLRTGHWGRLSEVGFRVLLVWPLYFYMRKSAVSVHAWFAGCAVAAVGACAMAAYQLLWQGLERAHGITNAVVFAQSLLAIALICLAGAADGDRPPLFHWSMLLGAVCACWAVLMSGTRGAWLAMLAVAPFFICYFREARNIRRIGLPLALSLLVSVLALQSLTRVDLVERVKQIHNEVNTYVSDPYAPTSVGTRLLMWEFAWDLFGQRPWVGHGDSGYKQAREQEQRQGRTNSQFGEHAHNEVLNVLAKFGGLGLLPLLAVYFTPMCAAWRWRVALIHRRKQSLWIVLWLLPPAYFAMGLSDVPLDWVEGVTLYFYSIALICGWVDRDASV